jgi:hypothetical protein
VRGGTDENRNVQEGGETTVDNGGWWGGEAPHRPLIDDERQVGMMGQT